MRVLVEPALIAVRRQVIEVEIVLLDILPVVSLDVREAEQALLQDRMALVPQREREAQDLPLVAETAETVLTPTVGARSRRVMGEVRPGVAALAVVLPRGTPLPLAEIGSPSAPGYARARLLEAALLHRGCVVSGVSAMRDGAWHAPPGVLSFPHPFRVRRARLAALGGCASLRRRLNVGPKLWPPADPAGAYWNSPVVPS